MYLSNIIAELISVFSPIVIVYCFCVLLLDIVTRAFRGL